MKAKSLIISYLLLILLISSSNNTLWAQSSSCSQLDENRVGELLREAARLEEAGDEAGSQAMMEQAAQLAEADLLQAIEQPIPDPQGLFCKENPTVRHIACLLKLTARVELTGNSDLSQRGMQRASEGVDLWTTQFAYTIPPVGDELCKDYLACIFKAMAQRELIGIVHNSVYDLLEAKANEILEKGCEPCETKWVAVGKVNIEWRNDDEYVTMAGYAQWENFHLIANISELEDKCMHLEYDDRITFPYACDGGVVSHKGGKIKTHLTMTDGDETFAQDIVDGNLTICAENTVAPRSLRLLSYIGFSEHGQSVEINLTSHISAIKARRPFTVSEVVRVDELPSYQARFKFMFYPVSGWELSEF
ncbi:MAG: hypothetical protein FD155_1390 [Bacteroidetes bacterium]|nr:MAG: hypothetical protein FD155_1390 [Bacteroidota bacterium]